MTRKRPGRPQDKAVAITVEVRPRSPRIVYLGMDAREEVDPVIPEVVCCDSPQHSTVFEGCHLLYARPTRDGVMPYHNGRPLLEDDGRGAYQYTAHAVALLSPGRRRLYLASVKSRGSVSSPSNSEGPDGDSV
jgi:hypothetical protein